MPPAKWAEIQNSLDENLFESGGQITFGNDFIRKAVEDRHLRTEEDKRAAHRWLGEWFEGREATLDVAQERVHQWRQAGNKERLRSCLLEETVFSELYKQDYYALLDYWLYDLRDGAVFEDIEKAYEAVVYLWKNGANQFNLGLFLRTAGYTGRFTERLHRSALKTYQNLKGAEHPDTLGCVSNLADLLCEKGDYEAAEPLYRRALEGEEQLFGSQHPAALDSVRRLAGLMCDKGDYEAAESLHRRALEACETVLGAQHSQTLVSVEGLAITMGNKGAYAVAEPLYRRALGGFTHTFGPGHPKTLFLVSAIHRLALHLFRKGEVNAVEAMLRLALEGNELVHGKASPFSLTCADLLAHLLNQQDRRPEAIKLLRPYAFYWREDETCVPAHDLTYNLACYECLSGNETTAKDLLAEIIKKHPEKKEQALADEDFASIRDFIKSLPDPKNEQ